MHHGAGLFPLISIRCLLIAISVDDVIILNMNKNADTE